MDHLLLLSLGPVQDFIATARRCQDLWFGSWLLSELSRAAAAAGGTDSNVLVFPADPGNEDRPGVANKILIRVCGSEARQVAERAQRAMVERLHRITDAAFRHVPATHLIDVDLARRQIDDLIELAWVAVPENGDYRTAWMRVESLLAARKATRDWMPVPWAAGHGVPKSSLDGQRESVLHERLFEPENEERWTRLRRALGLRKSERLCGIGLLKRIGAAVEADGAPLLDTGRRPVFHSTSHMAAMPLLTRWANRPGAAAAWNDYLSAWKRLVGDDVNRYRIQTGFERHVELDDPLSTHPGRRMPVTFGQEAGRGFDGYLLYETRLPDVLDECGADAGAARGIASALRRFLVDGLDYRREVPAYYAVLVADGDRVGKAIAELGTFERHRGFGERVDAFSIRAGHEVARFGGSLIYSGGDDVMALLPLHTALRCAFELQQCFREQVGSKTEVSERPTLSVGLALVHHLEPLREALDLARRAETMAKSAGRNRLALLMSKRSGAPVSWVAPWDDLPVVQVERWMKALRSGALPDGVAFELERLLEPFEAPSPGSASRLASFDSVLLTLAKRVVLRKRTASGADSLGVEEVQGLLEPLERRGELPVSDALRNLSGLVQIARLFLDVHDVAWG